MIVMKSFLLKLLVLVMFFNLVFPAAGYFYSSLRIVSAEEQSGSQTDSKNIKVKITPENPVVEAGSMIRFSAVLEGDTGTGSGSGQTGGTATEEGFSWSVEGDNPDFNGYITRNGDYISPNKPGMYYVKAKSRKYPLLDKTIKVTVKELPVSKIDFEISRNDISMSPKTPRPGQFVSLKVKVHNLSTSGNTAGGSVARFMLGDRLLDEVPFYIDKKDQYKEIGVRFIFPSDGYTGLTSKQQSPAILKVSIDPYNKANEKNENNNNAELNFFVKGIDRTAADDHTGLTAVYASGLSASCSKGNELKGVINAALPGSKLVLKAKIRNSSSTKTEKATVSFLIDGQIVKQEVKSFSKVNAPVFVEMTGEYYVPVNARNPLHFDVLLGNGSKASVVIPVVRHDIGLKEGDLYWEGEQFALPGKSISPKAMLSNYSLTDLPLDNMSVAYRILLDGELYYEGKWHVSDNSLIMAPPVTYKVPLNKKAPILMTVVADPYHQLPELDESNNISSVYIPVSATGGTNSTSGSGGTGGTSGSGGTGGTGSSNTGTNNTSGLGGTSGSGGSGGSGGTGGTNASGNAGNTGSSGTAGGTGNTGISGTALSVLPDSPECIDRPAKPGSNIILKASVFNASSKFPGKNLTVHFKINGNIVHNFTIAKNLLKPMQSRIITKSWRVSPDIKDPMLFEVVIDPAKAFADDNKTDNTASSVIPVEKPDFSINDSNILISPENPKAGNTALIKAIINNNGIFTAKNVKVRFEMDGKTEGEAIASSIQGASAGEAVFSWKIPASENLAQLPWTNLEGKPGKLPLPEGISKEVNLRVEVDPDKTYDDSNRDNNLVENKKINVFLPYDKFVVYVRASDILGGVPGASMELSSKGNNASSQASSIKATALSSDDGWCTFTGVPAGSYTITIKKDGYFDLVYQASTSAGNISRTHNLDFKRKSNYVSMVSQDSDNDLLSDEYETLYGTDKNKEDTDGDGIIDGKDISPLLNPSEPSAHYLQKKGMVRLEQPVAAYGLDGWTEVWDMDLSISSMSDKLVYSKTEEETGTRKSKMDQETYKKAINRLYEDEKLKAYKMKNITPADIHYGGTEMKSDKKAEDSYIFPADHFHRTEYRFYYDYLSDYQLAYLKNTEEILFPSNDSYYAYYLMPVRLKQSKGHTFSIQFTQNGLASTMYYNNDKDYSDIGFQYSFYENSNFDDDDNKIFWQGMALADTDDINQFTFSINIPAQNATYSTAWLKITPVRITRKGNNQTYSPLYMSWNITGITREVVLSSDDSGNSKALKEEFPNMEGLNSDVMEYSYAMTFGSQSSKARTFEGWAGLVSFDGSKGKNDPERFRFTDLTLKILSYADKGTGGADKVFNVIEKIVLVVNKKKEITDLDKTHWARQTNYGTVLAGFEVAQGIVTIYTDGVEAWKAYKEGDNIACVYYSAKGLAAGANTAYKLATISKNVVAWSGKMGRFSKLASDKVGVGIAIATGVIETSYNIARWSTTDDPIRKSAYGEKVFESMLDTVLSSVAVVYAPLIAFQLTWTIGIEIYGYFVGNDLAYRVAHSPPSAVTFIVKYWAEGIPSQIASDAYDSIKEDYIDYIANINTFGAPFIAVFIDPEL